MLWRHTDQGKAWKLAYRKRNKAKELYGARQNQYKMRYGLTIESVNDILVFQDNRCIICNTKSPKGKRPWHVDHDHNTGTIRSVLCYACNQMIGFAREKPSILRMAAKYLEYHHAQS